ncbi:hypothetical protein ABT56_05740 [Photobacterium aquae]|uniref:Uncharacterized protein n=1 Tax=Photobacterium aquae TaxID=1195763 RepID=A0A0J1H5K0_9GAMM|nr:hypothetical protein [Photobacterium aquae]KLV07064.1 hypothetical protein ABT56_05740 [Photobacterium aquae]
MSFSDHLDNILKQREQKAQGLSVAGQPRKHTIQDPTNQSLAREAMAKAQEDASRQAEYDTKLPHCCINGRYVTEEEAEAMKKMHTKCAPANPDRIAYINQLRRNLKLKKRN